MSNTIKFATIFSLLIILALSSCKKDPDIPNEEELITTLIYTLTPHGGGDPVVFSFKDPDGDGGQAPVITSGTLAYGTHYHGAVTLLDESETPAEDITEEVEEEGAEHQLFFIVTGVKVTITYEDGDVNGRPIGIHTQVEPEEPGQGTLRIVLRHQPDKEASGVGTGIIDNAGGETDIEVTFPLVIQ